MLLQEPQLLADNRIFRDKTNPDPPNCDVQTEVPRLFHPPMKKAEVMAVPSTFSIGKKSGVQLSEYVASEFIYWLINYCAGKMDGVKWQIFRIQQG